MSRARLGSFTGGWRFWWPELSLHLCKWLTGFRNAICHGRSPVAVRCPVAHFLESCTGLNVFFQSKVLCSLFLTFHSFLCLPLSPLKCKFPNKTCTEPLTQYIAYLVRVRMHCNLNQMQGVFMSLFIMSDDHMVSTNRITSGYFATKDLTVYWKPNHISSFVIKFCL